MPPKVTYPLPPEPRDSTLNEAGIEDLFIQKLRDLKYTDRPDIHDRASLEKNFREKFEALNRVRLTDSEFARLLEEIVTPDVFTAAKTLRQINAFTRDDDLVPEQTRKHEPRKKGLMEQRFQYPHEKTPYESH